MRTAMRIGSWLSILTGTLHLLAHFKGLEPTSDAERTMLDMMARLRFDAGGVERTMMDLFGGLSLAFSTLLFLMGLHGLRHARSEDGSVRREAAFAYATTAAVLTGLGLLYFPTPPIVPHRPDDRGLRGGGSPSRPIAPRTPPTTAARPRR